jgi:hypothetical protein
MLQLKIKKEVMQSQPIQNEEEYSRGTLLPITLSYSTYSNNIRAEQS